MPSSGSFGPRLSLRGALIVLIVTVVLAVAGLLTNYRQEVKALLGNVGRRRKQQPQVEVATDNNGHYLALPGILVRRGIYPSNASFANEAGVIPAYWEGESNNNQTSSFRGDNNNRKTLGPCYPNKRKDPIDWEAEIEKYNTTQQPSYNYEFIKKDNALDVRGYCRPGFLIIGAGKCGTSSLYHYISMHPKVLPALQKQIHYFKYHKHEPLKWYYQHFPNTASFLAAGALLTGEASPGYLPYPDVVIDMKQKMPEPRLLAIGRNPIERAYSSYKYNYVNPHLQYLRMGKGRKDIPKRQPEQFYNQYLFSFEDMIKAELGVLRECFAAGSQGEKETRQKWGNIPWIQQEYKRREQEGLPPLIDLDGFCYGTKVNETVIRRQWINLVAEQPNKVILPHNLHLIQALIGRSLYLFPLEWWYTAFPPEHIYFICTEELQDFSGWSMNSVGQFLGLPRYENFSAVVQGGAFNVGGHKGYDHEISWSQLKEEHQGDEGVPLSDELRLELEEFIRPYNERLFAMTGRRCNW